MVTPPKYYSQAGQDKWVCELLNFKRDGFFVDIGAYDGVKFSNSYTLELLGWKGICVEANKKNFNNLQAIRMSVNINAALTHFNGYSSFIENDMYGSTIIKPDDNILNIAVVESKTMGTILSDYHAPSIIDYLSLDIEGGEAAALSVFPFDQYKIRALTVEHNFYNSGPANKNKIYGILTEAGYTRVKEVSADGLHFEDWYVYPSLVK